MINSEVAIMCEEGAYKLFKQVFTKEELYITPDKIYKEADNYILYWDWIKWDDYMSGVRAIISVMKRLDENEADGYSYKFLRLGESDNDVESISNNDTDMDLYITRKIYIPDGFEEIDVKKSSTGGY